MSEAEFQTTNAASEVGIMNIKQCFALIIEPFKANYNFLNLRNDFVFSNYMVKCVCKTWYSAVKIDVAAPPVRAMEHFAKMGNLNVLKWFQYVAFM